MARRLLLAVLVLAMAGVPLFAAGQQEGGEEELTVALLVKNIGNPFFDVVKRGWDEGVEDIGVNSVYRGPEQPTAEGQIEIMNQLISQRVDAITYVANDPDAIVPVAQEAMEAGIGVNGWESGIVAESRDMAVEPASAQAIGAGQVEIIAELIDYEGKIAILSASSTMANQNTWIDYMQQELEKDEYSDIELVEITYGDDVREKSYNEAIGLMRSHPDLKGIISPTTVGIAATARAVTDEGKIGEVEVTGLGLPSQMAEYVENGACKEFGLWNPIDLGYLNAWVSYHLGTGEITGAPGENFEAGRLGSYTIEAVEGVDWGLVYLGELFRFNEDNIDEFKDLF